MKLISVVTACYNEEDNVREFYGAVKRVLEAQKGYSYEHIFIDNASKDRTVALLKEIAKADKRVKIIVNARNFGHVRSPYHGLLQASGDAVILTSADFQDPPDLIPAFIRKWEEGYKAVLGVKDSSAEPARMFAVRRLYYRLISRLSSIELIENFTGYGLYDRVVIDTLRKIDDHYPYFRGLISDLGYESAKVPFQQPARRAGATKSNFYILYDMAMLGITNHSKVPLRIAAMLGFAMSAISLLIAFGYLAAKLLFWYQFPMGTAPIMIGVFFFSSVQLFFIGVIGEYIGSIHTQVLKRPLVIEKERVNFD